MSHDSFVKIVELLIGGHQDPQLGLLMSKQVKLNEFVSHLNQILKENQKGFGGSLEDYHTGKQVSKLGLPNAIDLVFETCPRLEERSQWIDARTSSQECWDWIVREAEKSENH
jgi:hypothetical protein